MDTSTTLAVNILVRTSMTGAQNQWSKAIDRMEKDVRDFVGRVNKLFAQIKYPKGPTGGATTGGRGGGRAFSAQGAFSPLGWDDAAMRNAQRDIARMQAQRRQMETNLTNHLAREGQKREATAAQSARRSAEAAAKALRDAMKGGVQNVHEQLNSLTKNQFFSGVFWSTVGAMMTARIVGAFAAIPGLIRDSLQQATEIASQRQNAALGLGSVAGAKGQDRAGVEQAVKNLRLVKAGIVDIAEASTAMKNLLASNFNLAEATQLLESFSDTAAFGKQQALDFGEAIRGATEGIKNGNSILVDNVGLTKNLSVILKEAGFAETDLMRATQDANIRRALYNGLIKEASINLGDADKLTTTYTASVANLELAQKNLYAAVGNNIIQNKQLIESNKILAETLNEYSDSTNKASSDTAQFVTKATNLYAQLKASGISTFLSASTAIGGMVTALAAGLGAIATAVISPFEAIVSGVEWLIGQTMLKLSNFNNWLVNLLGPAGTALTPLRTVDTSKMEQKMKDFSFFPLTTELWRATKNLGNITQELFTMSNRYGAEGAAAERRVRLAGTGADPFAPRGPLGVQPRNMQDLFRKGPEESRSVRVNKQGLLETIPLNERKGFNTSGAADTSGLRAKTAKVKMDDIDRGLQDAIDYMTSIGLNQVTSGSERSTFHKGQGHYDRRTLDFSIKRPDGTYDFAKGEVARRELIQMGLKVPPLRHGTAPHIHAEVPVGGLSTGKRARDFEEELAYERLRQGAGTMLENIRQRGPGAITGGAGVTTIGTDVTTSSEAHINRLRESLNLEQRVTDLAQRQITMRDEIKARMEDYTLSLQEATEQNKIDLALAQARLPLIEAQNDFEKSRVDQTSRVRDMERDMAVLRMQNMDAQFVAQRRFLAAKEEELGYQRDISQMQDQLANQGMNDGLRVQLALLRDIYEIREREAEAIMDINRANLEITQQTVYSANQANAQILQYMASQKGVTESMADFKIGLMESGYDLIDRGLDKIIPKMGVFSDTIKDVLNSFIRLALNSAFRRLFGLDAGGGTGGMGVGAAQAGMGGGLSGVGSITSRIFGGGGGGGGMGPGGTPMFNPNASFGNIFTGAGGGLSGAADIVQRGGAIDFGNVLNTAPGTARNLIDSKGNLIGMSGNVLGAGAGGSGGAAGRKPLMSQTLQTQLMGAIMGGTMGAGLGQGSMAGMALGGVGGAIAGTLGMGLLTSGSISGATTGGIFGANAGIFGLSGAATFGIGLAVAGGLMLASYLFGRSARRKKEKREVERLSGDVISQIQTLINDVQAFRIDGKSAYSQGTQIRDQYLEEIKKLKTGPGKELAQAKIPRINQMLTQLKSAGDQTDRMRSIAESTDAALIPTFHSGGFMGAHARNSLVMARGHEAMLTHQNIMALGGYRALQEAGVRGLPSHDSFDRTARSTGGGFGEAPRITIVAVTDDRFADEIVREASVNGFAKKVRLGIDRDEAGVMSRIEDRLATGR